MPVADTDADAGSKSTGSHAVALAVADRIADADAAGSAQSGDFARRVLYAATVAVADSDADHRSERISGAVAFGCHAVARTGRLAVARTERLAVACTERFAYAGSFTDSAPSLNRAQKEKPASHDAGFFFAV